MSNELSTLRSLLKRLPTYIDNNWTDLPDGAAYFGTGTATENGIRTNSNTVFAIAVLLKHAEVLELDEKTCEILRHRAKALVRFLVRSHVSGNGYCVDGKKWGLEWQSSWWATKLVLGADILGDLLSSENQAAIRGLIAEEADRNAKRLIPTGLSEDTKAEETAWDAESLATALALNPESNLAEKWRERLVAFGINTFSRPSDQSSEACVDGIFVRDVLRSCNVHEDGSLENHGSAHFCYVASPLISKAWCIYALRRAGQIVPDALRWNVDKVWSFAEDTFLKNRFAYLSGQDWARYTYGEYFIVPALLFLADIDCGQRTGTIFKQRLATLNEEAQGNDDGSFFGRRFTEGRYYEQFAKYETDCFACIALSIEMLDEGGFKLGPEVRRSQNVVRVSAESLTCFSRQDNSLFSFSWRTLTSHFPNASMIPLVDDSLAEFAVGNLIGTLWLPRQRIQWVGVKAMEKSDRGIRITGNHSLRSARGLIAEHALSIELVDELVHIHSKYVASRPLRAVVVTGGNWSIPNDQFNGFRRRYYYEGSDGAVKYFESDASDVPTVNPDRGIRARLKHMFRMDGEKLALDGSRWVNVDNKIGLVKYSPGDLTLRRFGYRTSEWDSLNIERVEFPASEWRFNVQKGAVLLESSFVVHIGPQSETRKLLSEGVLAEPGR